MVRYIFCSLVIVLMFFSEDYAQKGNVDEVTTNIQQSNKFSKSEINEAIDAVKIKFVDFKGCTLTKLWYDEKKSDAFAEHYNKNGGKEESIIILLSNFDVDSSGGYGGFNPNSEYTNWNWILKRENKSQEWKVHDWGY